MTMIPNKIVPVTMTAWNKELERNDNIEEAKS